jgi:UDP-N-acetyl-D-mannosaminuronic acid dehydrogenase
VKKNICVIGLGTIGLPTACCIAMAGYPVLGVDRNEKVLTRIRLKQNISHEPGLASHVDTALSSGLLTLALTPAAADIYIICVPTTLTKEHTPDLTCLEAAIDAVLPFFKSGDLVIIESTCPIGTCESIYCMAQLSKKEVSVAYCPERVMPGNLLNEFYHNPRLIGGVDALSTEKAVAFYLSFLQVKISSTDARTAEMVKLAENTYRDVNIAFANELSLLADQVGIEIKKVIEIANLHPRVQIHTPGIGVGGYCLTVNPWFLAASAPEYALLSTLARSVNQKKTAWVVQKIQAEILHRKSQVIACLGLTYKPEVKETRDSPALEIVQILEKEFRVIKVDPYVEGTDSFEEAIEKADLVIVLVGHAYFKDKLFFRTDVLDFTGICT